METRPHSQIRFGVYEVDLAAHELHKSGARIRLQQQPFRVLAILLERPGEVVTREHLQSKLWPDETFVDFEDGLSTAVRKIRQALGDSASNPRFVETLPKRGYRFIAPVDAGQAAAPGAQPANDARTLPLLRVAALAIVGLALAAYLAGWLGPRQFDQTVSFATPVPLTSYPGREIHPSFSPDGQQVTFTWEGPDRDNWDIYVKRVGEDRADRLTDDPAQDFNSVWSPDGRRIAFIRRYSAESAEVMTVPAIGGPARRVLAISGRLSRSGMGTHSSRFVTWHPDGRHLVVVMPEGTGGLELHAVDADTGDSRKLVAAPSQARDVDPAVSPDASKLAFLRRGAIGSSEIHVVGLTASLEVNGESRRLRSEEAAFFPTWTPDSREIIFASGSGSTLLWRTTIDGDEPRAVMQPLQASFPAVSAAGRLAFAYIRRDFDTWELQPATGEKRRVISSTFLDLTPQYSPDGSKIAFSSSRSGHQEIWLCDRDGSNPTQLTDLKSRRTARPYWGPDGSWITFRSFVGDQPDVFVIRASGGEPRNLTDHPAQDTQPSISRDGRRIYFSSDRSGENGIWSIAPEGGEPVQVTSGNDLKALESVDGRTLYLSSFRSLWSMPTAGGPRTLEVERFLTMGNWAVGRSGVYFRGERNTPRTIDYYDFDSKAVSSVMKLEKQTNSGFSLSPDGKSILTPLGEPPESDIMLVEGFR